MVKDPGAVGQKFRHQAESWVEQRMFGRWALEALVRDESNAGLVRQIEQDLEGDRAQLPPSLAGYTLVSDHMVAIETAHFTLRMGATGGLSSLVTKADGHEWVGSEGSILQFEYQARGL